MLKRVLMLLTFVSLFSFSKNFQEVKYLDMIIDGNGVVRLPVIKEITIDMDNIAMYRDMTREFDSWKPYLVEESEPFYVTEITTKDSYVLYIYSSEPNYIEKLIKKKSNIR